MKEEETEVTDPTTPTRAGRTLVLLTLNEIEGVTALHPRIPYDCADEVFAVDGGMSSVLTFK